MLTLFFLNLMEKFRLDRTAFKMHHTKDNCNNYDYWRTKTFEERLQAANYLNSVAYNFPINDPPKLDRTYFKMRSRK
jgi:hypothetical protein